VSFLADQGATTTAAKKVSYPDPFLKLLLAIADGLKAYSRSRSLQLSFVLGHQGQELVYLSLMTAR